MENAGLADAVRVRFAPSPTGEPHIGNLRTALFNWLFARHHGGTFVLRIEDTDQKRYTDRALRSIMDSLRWLGLDWDEGPEADGPYGPYFQSQRLDIYQKAAEELIAAGLAYRCYCSVERLEEMRGIQRGRKNALGYDGRCRMLTDSQRRAHEAGRILPVVRFKMSQSGETTFHDLIRNEVTWQNELLDDYVILKSDGYPTYHLANVVDDHLMEISHVMRAEEWLSSTPRHVQLYRALGYVPPIFAHLPIILGTDRSKLSKRHGSVSLLKYRSDGFLPEAMINFMSLLGWSLDDKTEVMSRDMLVEKFSAERIVRSGAIFDREKLLWMNGMYIRQLDTDELTDRILPFLEKELHPKAGPVDRAFLLKLTPLLQERIKTLGGGIDQEGSAAEIASYFFLDNVDPTPEQLLDRVREPETAVSALNRTIEVLEDLQEPDHADIEATLRATALELGLSASRYFGMLRMALTGRTASPPLFETMELLGKDRCLNRIRRASETLLTQHQPRPV